MNLGLGLRADELEGSLRKTIGPNPGIGYTYAGKGRGRHGISRQKGSWDVTSRVRKTAAILILTFNPKSGTHILPHVVP